MKTKEVNNIQHLTFLDIILKWNKFVFLMGSQTIIEKLNIVIK